MMPLDHAAICGGSRAGYTDLDVMGIEAKHRYTTKCFDQGDEMSVPLGYLFMTAMAAAWAMACALAGLG